MKILKLSEIGDVFKSPLTVAWVAIFISLSQMVFTVPIITKLFFFSDVRISDGSDSGHEGASENIKMYSLTNVGRGEATNLEVGFLVHLNSIFQLLPAVSFKESCDSKPLLFKHCRLEFQRLLPGEKVVIIIANGPPPDLSPDIKELLADLQDKSVVEIPSAEFIRSDQGFQSIPRKTPSRSDITRGVIERQSQ